MTIIKFAFFVKFLFFAETRLFDDAENKGKKTKLHMHSTENLSGVWSLKNFFVEQPILS